MSENGKVGKRFITLQYKKNDGRIYLPLNSFKELSLIIGEPIHIINDDDSSMVNNLSSTKHIHTNRLKFDLEICRNCLAISKSTFKSLVINFG